MSDSKGRYEVSRALMNTLPSIREESFRSDTSRGTPRNVKRVKVNDQEILVRTLPPDPSHQPPLLRELSPVVPDDLQASVDQTIADYLHYARYSASIPVKTEQWDSNETLYCTCCNERNTENIRRQRGLPPEKPNYTTSQKADDTENMAATSRSPRVLYSPRESWMNYQPLPYAQTYLSPEFNRPSVVHKYQDAMKGDDASAKTRAEILESNTKYDQAMKKLKFTTQKLDPNFDENKMSFS